MAVAVAVVLFAGVLLYAIFAGADFGAGIWDLTAGRGERGGRVRTLVDHSLGPVWEANHVWLIFVLVILWTGFPRVFAAICTHLFVPLSLAALGIVLRGAAFAFRKVSASWASARALGIVFALSSLLTPYFLGSVAGAIASGRIGGATTPSDTWRAPLPLLGGILAVATCAYLAGVFLCHDAERAGQPEVAEVLRRRVIVVGAATGAIALAGALPLRHDAPTLFEGLTHRGLPLVAGSALAGAASIALVATRRWTLARLAAVAAVGAVLLGWGVGQYPWILVDHVRIEDGAGAPATLTGLLVVTGIAAAIVGPSLAWLFKLVQAPAWHEEHS